MVEGFSFRDWLRSKEKIISGVEVDKNAKQFEAAGYAMEHRTNALAYEHYDRKKANRKSRMELRKKKKSIIISSPESS